MFSERISRAEAHFYLQKLYNKGWEKEGMTTHHSGYIVHLKRVVNGREEHMSVKFSSSGWVSYS